MTKDTDLAALFARALEFDTGAYIPFGAIDLASNAGLLDQLMEAYKLHHPMVPSYAEFVKLLNSDVTAPKIPDQDDPQYDATPEQLAKFTGEKWKGKADTIKDVIRAKNILKAQEAYQRHRLDHAALLKRVKTLQEKYQANRASYISFLSDAEYAHEPAIYPSSLNAKDRAFIASSPAFRLKEFDRQRHTYITAETGHGKSVTIETLIHHYLHQGYTDNPADRPCLILIDPHGDLATTIASLRVVRDGNAADWLVYVKPALGNNLTPNINPFELKGKNWDDIALATDAFIEVFKEVMNGDKDGASFSPQMVTILKPVIATLLHMDHTSVADIIPFLSDERAEYDAYLNHARRYLSNPSQLEFLKRDFFKDSYNPSKLSIKTKIRNLLADDYFLNFLCGPTTVDLEALIKQRKTILFDLSDLTEAAAIAIGRFIMATITRFAFAQGEKPYQHRIPMHLCIDECQDYISDSMKQIVTKTRKFRLHGTFAQQFCGQGMNTELKRAIIGNSRIKITGRNETSSLKLIASETGATVEDLQALTTGEFHIKAGKAPSVAVKIPMIKPEQKITAEEWEERLERQVKRYYRLLEVRGKDQAQTEGNDAAVGQSATDEASTQGATGNASSENERGSNHDNREQTLTQPITAKTSPFPSDKPIGPRRRVPAHKVK